MPPLLTTRSHNKPIEFVLNLLMLQLTHSPSFYGITRLDWHIPDLSCLASQQAITPPKLRIVGDTSHAFRTPYAFTYGKLQQSRPTSHILAQLNSLTAGNPYMRHTKLHALVHFYYYNTRKPTHRSNNIDSRSHPSSFIPEISINNDDTLHPFHHVNRWHVRNRKNLIALSIQFLSVSHSLKHNRKPIPTQWKALAIFNPIFLQQNQNYKRLIILIFF